MTSQSQTDSEGALRHLGDGLILRRATVADAEPLAAFNAQIHGSPDGTQPDERIGIWTRDLMERPHPTVSVGDFLVVEDSATGAIVSSLNSISQTWTYGGIPFGVGRPELVGTRPEYRHKRLVRAQFEVVHRWSAERGEMVQAITGIPYYYRQFGYEMALDLEGGRSGYQPHVPALQEGEVEPYRVRPALETDLAFIATLYEQAANRYVISCVRDRALWEYELKGRSERNFNHRPVSILESEEGEPVGFVAVSSFLWWDSVGLTTYELKPGVSWSAVTPSVVRYLWATGQQQAQDENKTLGSFAFGFGREHPAYEAFRESLPSVRPPYAWYVRVPDLPGFLRHIAPVLERRLAASPLAGHSAELKISFYRTGLRLVLVKGRLAEVGAWRPSHEDQGKAGFPDLTFLQLVFGYRSLDEMVYTFADCWTVGDEPRALLNALFPKQASHVWPVA